MKNRFLQVCLAVLVVIFCNALSAQTMYVRPLVGTQSAYNTDNIQKLTFSNGNLLVTSTLGVVESHPLAGNRYINFTDLTLATSNTSSLPSGFYVYPNPSSHMLHLFNTNPNKSIELVQVMSLDGKLLMQVKPMESNNTQLDISALPQGMYLCKISSDNQQQTLKFLKQ
ncbi:MAG: T9SS type A sorting domain-containing protein [Flavobacterium sp.]|nr:T9SS type A sorting domain-containing protein [Flavobacterium sp.]